MKLVNYWIEVKEFTKSKKIHLKNNLNYINNLFVIYIQR